MKKIENVCIATKMHTLHPNKAHGKQMYVHANVIVRALTECYAHTFGKYVH